MDIQALDTVEMGCNGQFLVGQQFVLSNSNYKMCVDKQRLLLRFRIARIHTKGLGSRKAYDKPGKNLKQETLVKQ
jgi:hypothetical protein